MSTIISYVTLGIVFGFCALGLILMLPLEKVFSRKGKRGKAGK